MIPASVVRSVSSPRHPSATFAAMATLAGLDIVGAALARHWADHRSTVALVGGMCVFALVFVVYGKSLDFVQLTTLTVGWMALLQAGIVLLDRFQGHTVAGRKLTAVAAIVLLEVYLVVIDS